MSVKINKNDKEYPIGVVPQSLYDDVEDLKEANKYLTTEHKVGKWIDGSDLYEKTVYFGALPNTTVKTVSHGISFSKIISAGGIAATNDYGYSIPVPFTDTNLVITSSVISIESTIDRSSFTNTYITIRYTKP